MNVSKKPFQKIIDRLSEENFRRNKLQLNLLFSKQEDLIKDRDKIQQSIEDFHIKTVIIGITIIGTGIITSSNFDKSTFSLLSCVLLLNIVTGMWAVYLKNKIYLFQSEIDFFKRESEIVRLLSEKELRDYFCKNYESASILIEAKKEDIINELSRLQQKSNQKNNRLLMIFATYCHKIWLISLLFSAFLLFLFFVGYSEILSDLDYLIRNLI